MSFGGREFLQKTAAAALTVPPTRAAKSADSRVTVLLDETIGIFSPTLHGQFTKHIGGVIYDGVWVGENSPVPNVGGIRKDLIEALRKLSVPVVRWPGGCFADSYDWRDGIGPRSKRSRRTNFWVNDPLMQKAPGGLQKYEPNQFGTDEFMRFCALTGAAVCCGERSQPESAEYGPLGCLRRDWRWCPRSRECS